VVSGQWLVVSDLRAGSIFNKIAEGCGRRSTGELIQFIGMARGSTFEVQTQLVIATKLHFGTQQGITHCDQLSTEVTKMLNAWMNSLKAKQANTNH